MKILFLTRHDSKEASSSYRFLQSIPYLETAGFECIVSLLFNVSKLENKLVVTLLSIFIKKSIDHERYTDSSGAR